MPSRKRVFSPTLNLEIYSLCHEDFLCISIISLCPRVTIGTVGRTYKHDLYKLLHTKYESSRPCSFREEDLFCFSHRKSMGANDPWGGVIYDPRDPVGRMYKGDHYILLHTKHESSGPCGFDDSFLCFSLMPPGRDLYGPQGHGWQD